MSTAAPKSGPGTRTLLHSNPVISRLSRIDERSETDAATYRGIAVKTSWFLAVTLVGMLLHLVVKGMMADEPVWQSITVYEKFTVSLTRKEAVIAAAVLLLGFVCELVGIFVRKTIPVTGTLYAASQGYVISFLVFKVLTGYEHLGLEAFLLTVAVVAVMSYLYASSIVRVDKKFRTVLLALVLGSIGLGLLGFLGTLIPATRPYVQALAQNTGLIIAMDVVGLVIAALFLISDFSMVDDCVRLKYPKAYEWSAAFGLVFTVIWIYLKILDLLMRFADDKKN